MHLGFTWDALGIHLGCTQDALGMDLGWTWVGLDMMLCGWMGAFVYDIYLLCISIGFSLPAILFTLRPCNNTSLAFSQAYSEWTCSEVLANEDFKYKIYRHVFPSTARGLIWYPQWKRWIRPPTTTISFNSSLDFDNTFTAAPPSKIQRFFLRWCRETSICRGSEFFA